MYIRYTRNRTVSSLVLHPNHILPLRTNTTNHITLTCFRSTSIRHCLTKTPFPTCGRGALIDIRRLHRSVHLAHRHKCTLSSRSIALNINTINMPVISGRSNHIVTDLSTNKFISRILTARRSLTTLLHSNMHRVRTT